MRRDAAGRFVPQPPQVSLELASPAVRRDGMLNMLTGLGDRLQDKSEHTRFVRSAELSAETIDAMYEQDGLAAKLIDIPADDLTREGFELEDLDIDDIDPIRSAIEDSRILHHASDTYRWGLGYGGALLCAAVDDGGLPSEPLDLNRIDRVREFFVLDRHEVTPLWMDGRGNGPPDGYAICTEGVPIEERVIHASRTVQFIGGPMPRRARQRRMWWGASIYQRVWQRFRRLLSAYGYAEGILQDVSVDVFVLAGLADAFKDGDDEAVRKRLLGMQLSKSVLRAIALDAGDKNNVPAEEYVSQSRNVSGVRELVEIFVDSCVWAGKTPRSRLLGETSGGLNSGANSGETRAHYDNIGGEQKKYATPMVNWALELLFASKQGPTRGVRPPTWSVCWNPLWKMTASELEDERAKRAKTDQVYFDIGAASSEMVFQTRIVKGSHGELEPLAEEELPPDSPDESEQLGAAPKPEGGEAPEGGTPVGGDAGDVQTQAMNGAQMKEVIGLAEKIVGEQLPEEFGIEFLLVACPGVIKSREQAQRLLRSLEGFEPKKPDPPPMPAGGPPAGPGVPRAATPPAAPPAAKPPTE